MNTRDTDEPNGSDIIVPIKTQADLVEFRTQAEYWTGLWNPTPIFSWHKEKYSDVSIVEYITDDIFIVKINKEKYKYSIKQSSPIFVYSDGIPYPVTFNDLGLQASTPEFNFLDKCKHKNEHNAFFKLGIKVDIGEITMSGGRESIHFDDHTKQIIKNKIIKFLHHSQAITIDVMFRSGYKNLIEYLYTTNVILQAFNKYNDSAHNFRINDSGVFGKDNDSALLKLTLSKILAIDFYINYMRSLFNIESKGNCELTTEEQAIISNAKNNTYNVRINNKDHSYKLSYLINSEDGSNISEIPASIIPQLSNDYRGTDKLSTHAIEYMTEGLKIRQWKIHSSKNRLIEEFSIIKWSHRNSVDLLTEPLYYLINTDVNCVRNRSVVMKHLIKNNNNRKLLTCVFHNETYIKHYKDAGFNLVDLSEIRIPKIKKLKQRSFQTKIECINAFVAEDDTCFKYSSYEDLSSARISSDDKYISAYPDVNTQHSVGLNKYSKSFHAISLYKQNIIKENYNKNDTEIIIHYFDGLKIKNDGYHQRLRGHDLKLTEIFSILPEERNRNDASGISRHNNFITLKHFIDLMNFFFAMKLFVKDKYMNDKKYVFVFAKQSDKKYIDKTYSNTKNMNEFFNEFIEDINNNIQLKEALFLNTLLIKLFKYIYNHTAANEKLTFTKLLKKVDYSVNHLRLDSVLISEYHLRVCNASDIMFLRKVAFSGSITEKTINSLINSIEYLYDKQNELTILNGPKHRSSNYTYNPRNYNILSINKNLSITLSDIKKFSSEAKSIIKELNVFRKKINSVYFLGLMFSDLFNHYINNKYEYIKDLDLKNKILSHVTKDQKYHLSINRDTEAVISSRVILTAEQIIDIDNKKIFRKPLEVLDIINKAPYDDIIDESFKSKQNYIKKYIKITGEHNR